MLSWIGWSCVADLECCAVYRQLADAGQKLLPGHALFSVCHLRHGIERKNRDYVILHPWALGTGGCVFPPVVDAVRPECANFPAICRQTLYRLRKVVHNKVGVGLEDIDLSMHCHSE